MGQKTRQGNFAPRQCKCTQSKTGSGYDQSTWLYSPDLAPPEHHLFSSMGHALAELHSDSYEEVENWVPDWFALKDEQFYWRGIHKLPERWSKCVENNGQYFE